MRNPAEATGASRAPDAGVDPSLHLAAMLDRLDELIALSRAARGHREDRDENPWEAWEREVALASNSVEELTRLRGVVAASPDLRADLIDELREEIHVGARRTDSWRIAAAVLSEFAL